MNRRELVQAGILAVAASATSRQAFAQGVGAANSNKLKIDLFSRHLQWLRTPDEIAQALIEMGCDGVDLTVRPYPGHVDPSKVKADLPPLVNGLRSRGIVVDMISAPISDSDSPNAETILDTASSLGIKNYWWGTYRYDLSKSIQPQIEALKPRVAGIAKLSEKYGMKAMYHNFAGPTMVGATIFDLLQVLQQFDPRFVSFHYDTGQALTAGGSDTWALTLQAIGPYLGGVSFKDILFQRAPQGGPAPSAPPIGGQTTGVPAGGRVDHSNGWRSTFVPLGTGMLDMMQVAQILKAINFNGTVEFQPEFPNGGANSGDDKITLPRENVLGAMKKDQLTVRAALSSVGLI